MPELIDIEFEKALRMLVAHFPVSQEGSRKPILFHVIRVGVYLYENDYSRDAVLTGLLHDALEWSGITEELIRSEFGETVLQLVRANTKDRSIENSDQRIEDLAKRAAEAGRDALIIRAADTLDSFKHYTKTNNLPELDYCRKNALAIFKFKPTDFTDGVFEELGGFLIG
ncbi:MAG: HD domain-containing protein [Parcubacteria group bacterium]|jgi:(p)ppGpp synthase/HD superfamily hydrolase